MRCRYATQAAEPCAIIPLVRGARQVVLVGDHRQLGPLAASPQASAQGLSVSLFERLLACGVQPLLLQQQYRMHPAIAAWPSAHFYQSKLLSALDASCFQVPAPLEGPVSFVHVEGRDRLSGASRRNEPEARRAVQLVGALLAGGEVGGEGIGVVAMYRAQAQLIRALLQEAASGAGAGAAGAAGNGTAWQQVEVSTVDGFQGREKEVILVSTVRLGCLGFVGDERRLNVALTRPRRGLVVLGHRQTLAQSAAWASWLAALPGGG